MKRRTPHLDNLEKCKCQNKENIDKTKFTSISSHNGKSNNIILAEKIRINHYSTQYINRDTNKFILPPRNKY